jgi:hypothetical protein
VVDGRRREVKRLAGLMMKVIVVVKVEIGIESSRLRMALLADQLLQNPSTKMKEKRV